VNVCRVCRGCKSDYGFGRLTPGQVERGTSGYSFQDVAISEYGNGTLPKHPSTTLTPSASIRSGMTTFRTLHDLRSYRTPKSSSPAPYIVPRTVDAVSRIEVGDRIMVRLATCIRAS